MNRKFISIEAGGDSKISPGLMASCPFCSKAYEASQGIPSFAYWFHKERIGQVVALCHDCAILFRTSRDDQANLMVNAAAERIAQSYEYGGIALHHVPTLVYDLFGKDFHRAYAYWEFTIPNDIFERINTGEHTYRSVYGQDAAKWPDDSLSAYEVECDLARVTDPKSGNEFLLLQVNKVAV